MASGGILLCVYDFRKYNLLRGSFGVVHFRNPAKLVCGFDFFRSPATSDRFGQKSIKHPFCFLLDFMEMLVQFAAYQ